MPVVTRPEPSDAHLHLRSDEQLHQLMERHGYLAVEPAEDPFRRLIKAIGRQQVSMASATATWNRLTDEFEITPDQLRAADQSDLQAVGLSEAKSEYVRTVARVFDDRGWSRGTFTDQSDDAIFDELTEIKGVGPWTAKMFLQFGLGRENVFPVEDLGIRKGMEELYDVEARSEMRDQAAVWAPYRSIGSLYLWRAADEA